jgi:catechol 2,3-dioxygenase-like lactoylglutathione lyase family enzyme
MDLGPLDHVTLRVPVGKLQRIELFYRDLFGMTPGPRPDFPFPGLWLYHLGRPTVHIAATLGDDAGPAGTGECIDHFAFRATDAPAWRARLARLAIDYQEAARPLAGYQIFVRDPVGTRIELNFDLAEAPAR